MNKNNKEHNMLKKILLITITIIAIPFITFFLCIMLFIATDISADVLAIKQIKKEQNILINEYQPVLNYLQDYKEIHGVYPENIDEKILPKSTTFKEIKYVRRENKTSYWLEVKPKRNKIDYYYTDKNDDGHKMYEGTDYEDGFMSNHYYYEINKDWHAIRDGL